MPTQQMRRKKKRSLPLELTHLRCIDLAKIAASNWVLQSCCTHSKNRHDSGAPIRPCRVASVTSTGLTNRADSSSGGVSSNASRDARRIEPS